MKLTTPISQRLSLTLIGKYGRRAFIIGLFNRSCPSYITYFVMPIVINAIQRVLRTWTFAQMFKKLCKRVKAKFNAATAVVLPSHVIGSATSVFSRQIRIMFGCFVSTMLSVQGNDTLGSDTPTTTRITTTQGVCPDNAHVATVTAAKPFALTRIAQYNPTTKTLVAQVDKIIQRWMRLKFNATFIVGHLIKANSFNYLARPVDALVARLRAAFIIPQVAV